MSAAGNALKAPFGTLNASKVTFRAVREGAS